MSLSGWFTPNFRPRLLRCRSYCEVTQFVFGEILKTHLLSSVNLTITRCRASVGCILESVTMPGVTDRPFLDLFFSRTTVSLLFVQSFLIHLTSFLGSNSTPHWSRRYCSTSWVLFSITLVNDQPNLANLQKKIFFSFGMIKDQVVILRWNPPGNRVLSEEFRKVLFRKD